MKILVLGAGGMIGHKMVQILSGPFPETYGGLRRAPMDSTNSKVFNSDRWIVTGDVTSWNELKIKLDRLKPSHILNCVGVTLRKEKIKDLDYCLEVNSIFPHRLKSWCAQNRSHLIHFSTDCVFDGTEGIYTEDSGPTAKDIYGRTKYLGEVIAPHALTLRGSMIGREVEGKTELLEWAIANRGKAISGYSRVFYSGVTTTVMAEQVVQLLRAPALLSGIYQVSGEPISKYELLLKINEIFALNMKISPDEAYQSKKLLSSLKLKNATGFSSPSWDQMLRQIRMDPTPY